MAHRAEAGGASMSGAKRHMTMVARARAYLRHRRALGLALEATEYILLDFARFADGEAHVGPLTTDLMLKWATRCDEHSPRYHAERLSVVRGFARHVAAEDGRSEIPNMRLLAARFRREQPHVYTDAQLRELVVAAAALRADYPLRPDNFATLFGLLASTGLRVSEALALRRDDVDLGAGLLSIRQTKFRKSRLVPLHPSAVTAMRRFAARRDRDPPARRAAWFFVGKRGGPLAYTTVRCVFRRLCDSLGWRCNGTLPRPRIHDLRHSFACRRLACWYREHVDVDQAITGLSTYLGHGKVTDTYWYLSGTTELLSVAGARFESFAVPTRRVP